MLFDLTNPRRRRVIKVVYAVLAILFGVGFLFFFVGSEVGGGQSVFEAVGIGGASSSEEDINQDEIDDARERLEQNPNDRAALSDLVALYYQSGVRQVEIDEEAQTQTLTSEGEQQLQRAADAWDQYVKVSKGKIDSGTATLAFQTFSTLADASLTDASESTSIPEILSNASAAKANWQAAARVQQLSAQGNPNPNDYARAASLLYLADDDKAAEAAKARALELANPKQRTQIERQLAAAQKEGDRIARAVAQIRKQGEQQAAITDQLNSEEDNPLSEIGGGLGGGGTGLAP